MGVRRPRGRARGFFPSLLALFIVYHLHTRSDVHTYQTCMLYPVVFLALGTSAKLLSEQNGKNMKHDQKLPKSCTYTFAYCCLCRPSSLGFSLLLPDIPDQYHTPRRVMSASDQAGPSRPTPVRSLRHPALLSVVTRNDAGGLEPPSQSDAVALRAAMQRKVEWRRKGERWMDRFCEETVGKEEFKRGVSTVLPFFPSSYE